MRYEVRLRNGLKELTWPVASCPEISAQDISDLAAKEFLGIPLPPIPFNPALFRLWVEDETVVMGVNWDLICAAPKCWAEC